MKKHYEIIWHGCTQKRFQNYYEAINSIIHEGDNTGEYVEYWKSQEQTLKRVLIFKIFGFTVTIEKNILITSANNF